MAVVSLFVIGAWLFHVKDSSGLPKSDLFCTVETLARPVVQKHQLQVVDVSCDTLAKDESIRVYALMPAKSWFAKWKGQAKLLFSYDPGGPQDALPQIEATSDGKITISVPSISSIYYRTDQWDGKLIRYEIGEIIHP